MSDSITSLTPFALDHAGVETIQARVSCVEQKRILITYLANGDMGTLKIPAMCLPRRVDRLWEHTCFEAFIRADGDPSYYEFNFSPSSEWAVYAFRGYRDGSSLQDESWSPEIAVRWGVDRLQLDAVVRLDRLSTIPSSSSLRVGLSAVIEANDGTLFYWALKHPAAKPDFHHPDSFALELAFSSQSG